LFSTSHWIKNIPTYGVSFARLIARQFARKSQYSVFFFVYIRFEVCKILNSQHSMHACNF